MVKGLTGAALLCLSLPYLWFQWGWISALFGAIVQALLMAGGQPRLAAVPLLLAMLLLFRLESETSHVLSRDWQHRVVALQLCLHQPPKSYADYQSLVARVVGQPKALDLRYVRLTASPDVILKAGDCLDANVRVRQPLGQLVPGEFNPTRYYFSERIDALGTLTEANEIRSMGGLAPNLYQRARPWFATSEALGVWAALSLGWSNTLDPALAQLFNQTQIKHLVVVSGMHVGMVAGWALVLAALCCRLPGIGSGRPAWLRFALACGASGCFVMLTGFGFPGVRAWVMLTIPLALLAFGLRLGGRQILAIAAVAIALLRPQAWLSSGAWLSFGLVWVLIRLGERWRSDRLPNWRLAIRLQIGLSIVMVPVAAAMGFDWHPLSIPINLVMIPAVTLLVLPWSLLILVVPSLAWVEGYEWLVGQGIRALSVVAPWHTEAPAWTVLELALMVAGLAVAISQLYSGVYKWLLVPLFSLVVLYPATVQAPDEFRMTMLDVGHGEALVLQWPEQTWLYDTAGQWSNGASVAAERLDSWFRRRNIELDGIIISHSDLDHAGGAAWAVGRWASAARWSGEPETVGALSQTRGWRNCHVDTPPSEGMTWLAVPPVFQTNNNDRSCVVSIATTAGPVLITGDASRLIEYWLLQTRADMFPVGLQVIGHHGSHTSSARAFLNASPDAVFLVSSGDRASPRWPNRDLTAYMNKTRRPLLNTAERGTLEVTIDEGKITVRDWSSAYRLRLINSL